MDIELNQDGEPIRLHLTRQEWNDCAEFDEPDREPLERAVPSTLWSEFMWSPGSDSKGEASRPTNTAILAAASTSITKAAPGNGTRTEPGPPFPRTSPWPTPSTTAKTSAALASTRSSDDGYRLLDETEPRPSRRPVSPSLTVLKHPS